MSISRIAAILPSGSSLPLARCIYRQKSLRQFTLFLSMRTGWSNLPCSQVTINRDLQQRRHQSSEQKPKEQKPPMPPKKLFLRFLRDSLRIRPLLGAFRGQSLRSLFEQSPEELVLAIILLTVIFGICLYVVYAYFHYFQSEQFTRFPPHIAKSLRRALYYSNYGPDPKLAHKYYKMALEQCLEAGLDPFSDEVIGLRIQIAAWLEKIGSYANSIEVLESLLRDCKKWVELMEKSARDGMIDRSGRLVGAPKVPTLAAEEEDHESRTDRVPENLWAKRTRVLGKSVGISVKLGELHADEHVLQGDSAGECLIWAVETVLRELQRRQDEGVKEGEGDWMTPEQIGGALEALGNHYESKSLYYLAAPLFLQAISLSPTNSCHTAVLMNNLAISLAQQPVYMPAEPNQVSQAGGSNVGARPTRSTLLASARSWALQAQKTAEKVEGEGRTDECDEACAVALCNLGDIAAMTGDKEEARRKFKESLSLSKRIAFKPGTIQAQEGLQRISATPPTKSI
ncbi:TPR domain-containing protein [Jackrogersella minutella]|nr:TPR domain-containing protein [Jackrogersella minutella]